jgi:S1-C subfamily serine protease
MRRISTAIIGMSLVLALGRAEAADPSSVLPQPGAAAAIAAPALGLDPRQAPGIAPARLQAALNKLKPELPDLGASIGGSHASQLYRNLSPLVVMIVTDDGLGSGSLITDDGYVLTNNHVVIGFDAVSVILKPVVEGDAPSDADAFMGDVVKVDEVADLALVKIRNWQPWRFVELGDPDAIEVGDDVHAIGHPRGETWTYTKGVISAMRRGYSWSYQGEFKHQADVIQTQTPINPGNSGGPLFDDEGRLIGVNSFVDDQAQGLNFAVSVREVRRFLDAPDNRRAESVRAQDESGAEAGACAPAVLFTGRNSDDDSDIRMTDFDCNGYAEVIEVWPDSRTPAFTVEIDLDGNGHWEQSVVDSDGDGKWDYSLYDTDADGVVDLRGLHPDGAWEASSYEQV